MEQPAAPELPILLIVDDDVLLTDLFRQSLTKKGFQVLEAHSGQQALTLLAQRPVHLVVLDMTLPDMDGIAVARSLAQSHPSLPVLIATGHDPDPADLPANVVEIVRKPFSFRILSDRLKALLA